MILTLTFVYNINWRNLTSLLVLYFAGYVTRVVVEQIKPIWKTHKDLRRIQKVASIIHNSEADPTRDTPPNLRTKMKVAEAILNAEHRGERQTNPDQKA